MSLRDYRFLGEEAEALGRRLDAARKSLATAKSEWSKLYWKNTVDRLMFQWRHLPALHDGEARMQIIPRWTVKYDYYERDDGIGHGMSDRMFDRFFNKPDLTASWEHHRAERLAKAQ